MGLEDRMDDRTRAEFAKDISQFTNVERHLGNALRMDFNERGMKCLQHEYGVDNSGKIIEGNLDNFNPDKIFVFEDGSSQKIEIKSLPDYCWGYFTFKVRAPSRDASTIMPRFLWLGGRTTSCSFPSPSNGC